MRWREWFLQIWPDAQRRNAVVGQYASLRHTHPLMLADFALRNGLFQDRADAPDLFAAGVAEGRRRAALELFKLTKTPPEQLFDLVERKPAKGEQ